MRVPHQSPTMVPIVMYSQTVKQVQLHHPRHQCASTGQWQEALPSARPETPHECMCDHSALGAGGARLTLHNSLAHTHSWSRLWVDQ